MTLDEFKTMCQYHDLTYMYSDDGAAYRRGSDSLAKIREAAKNLPHDDVVRIWNEIVDSKLALGYRVDFYWHW